MSSTGAGSPLLSMQGATSLAACIGVPASTLATNPSSTASATFRDASRSDSVDDTVQVYRDAAASTKNFNAFANPRTPGCLEPLANAAVKGSAQPGVTIGTVTASATAAPLARIHGVSARAAGVRSAQINLSIPVSENGRHISVDVELVTLVNGGSESQVMLVSPTGPLDPTVVDHVVRAAAEKLT